MRNDIGKYTIIPLFIILFCLSNAYCAFFGLFGKSRYELTAGNKKESNYNQLVNKLDKLTSEFGVIKDNQLNITNKLNNIMTMQTDVSAKMTGWDQSLSNALKAGRDAFSTINDTGLMKSILIAFVVIILFVILAGIGAVVLMVKYFTTRKENKHVHNLIKHIEQNVTYFKQQKEDYKKEVLKKIK